MGAFLGILALSLWTGRGHFRGVLRAALYHPKNPEERLWRWALVVVAAGSLFLLGFAMLAGMSAGVAALFLGLYFALVIMLTRIRAEMGFPVHDLNGCPPDQTLVMVLGPAVLGPANVTGLALFHWFVRSLGFISHPMPHQLEAFKMADATGAGRRSMGGAMLLAGVVGIVGGFWLYLHRYYSVGADSAYWNGWTVQLGRETFTLLGSWLNSPADPDRGAAAATGFGFFLALALSALRLRLGRFPMHPLGYAVAPSWGMANLWSCVFLAWVAKTVILRSAGLKGYRRASPFFLGLVLGEFVCGAGWTLLGVLFDQPSYDFWP